MTCHDTPCHVCQEHALNISAIPRNKVGNSKKRKQETRQNISEIWEKIVDENISLLPTVVSFV